MKYEISPQDLERFYSKIKFNEETWCWDWAGTTLQRGYGHFKLKGKIWRPHRLSYLIHKGELIEGLVLHHLCRNRKCVNPEHLEQMASKENILIGESFSAVNKKKTHCIHGHEFTKENTRISPKDKRLCRKCEKINHYKYYHQDIANSRKKSRENSQKWRDIPENNKRRNAKRRKSK